MSRMQPRLSMAGQANCLLNAGSLGLNVGMVSPITAVPFEWQPRMPSAVQQPSAAPQGNMRQGLALQAHRQQLIAGQPSPVKPQNPAEQAASGQPRCLPPASGQQGMLRSEMGRIADRPPQEAPPPQAPVPAFFKQHSNPTTEDYLPPTSKHGYTAGRDSAPKHYLHMKNEHPYLTPSPESPEQWSSPSPHSMSDWSDSTPSPTIMGHQPQMQHMADQVTKMQVFA